MHPSPSVSKYWDLFYRNITTYFSKHWEFISEMQLCNFSCEILKFILKLLLNYFCFSKYYDLLSKYCHFMLVTSRFHSQNIQTFLVKLIRFILKMSPLFYQNYSDFILKMSPLFSCNITTLFWKRYDFFFQNVATFFFK